MNLKDVSAEDLEAELKRRTESKNVPPPVPLDHPDFTILIGTAVRGVQYAVRDGYIDKNFEVYIYEAAMEAIFGNTFWRWSRQQDHPG